jgi:tetratricopeptide (TPR) repeat protein
MGENASQPVQVPTAVEKQAAAEQFGLAKRLLTNGNIVDAIQVMRDCCRLDPPNLGFRQALRSAEQQAVKSGASGWLGTATLRTKFKMAKLSHSYMTVLEHGEALLARAPDDIGCQLDMAEAASALGLTMLALWILEHARRQEPANNAVNLAMSQVYETAGQLKQAIALLQKVATTHANNGDIQRRIKDLMAKETIHRGFDEKTAEPAPAASVNDTAEMARAEGTTTDKPAVPNLPGRLMRDIETMRARIAADPTNVNTYLPLVALLRGAGQFDLARDVLRDGLRATAHHVELALALADLKIEPKRRDLAALEAKIKAKPDDASLRSARTALLKDITQDELKMYGYKVKAQPTDTGARYELAVRLYRATNLQEAVREFQVTRDSPRYHWQSLAYLGLCFEKLQVWQLAQRNLQDALHKLPAEENEWRKRILFHLAEGAAAAGDLDQAITVGFELANLDFTHRGIDRLIAQWRKDKAEGKTTGSSLDAPTGGASLPVVDDND